MGFPGGLGVKNWPADAGDVHLIPGLGRLPGEGHGDPLQSSCPGNPMDRGAWRAMYNPWGRKNTRYDLATKQRHSWLTTWGWSQVNNEGA